MTDRTVVVGMYEVPGSRLRELRTAEAQRDRFREALERIASCASYAPGDCPDIAKTALANASRQVEPSQPVDADSAEA